MREIIIKPSIRRRCQIAMCGNTVTNSISRTAAPAQAGFFMCDACLKEAYAARFGRACTSADISEYDRQINAMITVRADLQAEVDALKSRIARMEADTVNIADTAEKPQEAPVNVPTQAEAPKQDKPKGGRKK